MISTYLKPVWLGYSQTGGAANLRIDELGGRLLLLGGHADEMAALLAFASREAGFNPIVLDLDGRLSSRVSGYFSAYRLADILYDIYRLEEGCPRAHAELLASAYTAALDLTFEEEAIMDAALQKLASEDSMASPPAVYDALTGVEGFRGFYVDKLKGRIGTLKSIDAADSASVGQVLNHPEGAIIDLSGLGMPRASELGAVLFIAKLLAKVASKPSIDMPAFVLVNGAHRVFKGLPRTQHGSRLLTAMLESRLTSVFASDQAQALSPLVGEACPTRIISADMWNLLEKGRRSSPGRWDKPSPPTVPPVLPNSFVLVHGFYGSLQPFLPRPFEQKASQIMLTRSDAASTTETGAESPPKDVTPEDALTKRILQELKVNDSPSMPSIVGYLSSEFPKEEVQTALDRLEKDGFVRLAPKEQKSGRTMLAIELTPKGVELLGRLA